MRNFNFITRRAILIGCPGPVGNFLHGVKKDVENMRRFLQSNKGGAWEKDEILTLQNPSHHEVTAFIRDTINDYTLVYFSGHGFTGLNDSRMISLRDCAIPDFLLLNDSPRQLVIVDACRNYTAPGLSGLPDFEEHVDHFESGAYELFNEYIACSPKGKLIVHATQRGQYSYDSPSGGYFTQALLQVATRMKTDQEYAACSVNSVLYHVPTVLRKNKNNQTPDVTYKSGDLSVPFALGSSLPALGGHRKEMSGEFVGVLMLAFLAVVVAMSSD